MPSVVRDAEYSCSMFDRITDLEAAWQSASVLILTVAGISSTYKYRCIKLLNQEWSMRHYS